MRVARVYAEFVSYSRIGEFDSKWHATFVRAHLRVKGNDRREACISLFIRE